MVTAALALLAGYGVHLLYTSLALRWTGLAPGPKAARRPALRSSARRWWDGLGLGDVRPAELAGAAVLLAVLGGGLGYALFGGVLAPLLAGGFAATGPLAAARARRERRRAEAREAWPRLLEELRIQTMALGRSVPQALFEVGARAPAELQPAFESARREWLLSTDFARAVTVLKARLADATADAVAETLLVAHALGGTEVDRCLAALVEDRMADLQGRKDAHARQAGARFARRFVLVVPLGMAALGLGVGQGRAAYGTPTGQLLVGVALALIGACWVWAGRIMRLPGEQRVFVEVSS